MAKSKKKPSPEKIAAQTFLANHTYWMVERFERINEQLMARAATFLGFIGVELALLGQLGVNEYNHHAKVGFALAISACAALLLCVFFLIQVLHSVEFDVPDEKILYTVMDAGIGKKITKPLKDLMDYPTGRNSWFAWLEAENSHRESNFRYALKATFLAQILVAVFITARWF